MLSKTWDQIDKIKVDMKFKEVQNGLIILQFTETHIPSGKLMKDKEIFLSIGDTIHLEDLLKDEDGATYAKVKYTQEIV